MVIGFKKQFVPLIMDGTKVHTIRDDKSKRWKPGMIMHMYTGGRFSKEYHQFALHECKAIQEIQMTMREGENGLPFLEVFIEAYSHFEFEDFVVRDGFNTIDEFVKWWMPIVESMPAQKFKGIIIHWTDLKY